MKELLRKMWSEDEGQDLVEYALIIALVSVALIGALTTLATDIGNAFAAVEAAL